ncbi:sugar kinase [Planotetraspora mira]|uniref:Sugar kinase n=1 Tax=Planotetraspora mira TaxID=58121 RepID=A0A8J3X8R5_9ACTN|nr:sugar kinase [Planotetraspora mira]GII32090.1 sugar kinase [Planotetraspora mira]
MSAVAGRPDVVGVGEAMVLLQPEPGGDLASADRLGVHVAGAELNVCAAIARLGLSASFASRVGDDPFGDRVIAAVRTLGVGTGLMKRDGGFPTGVFFKDMRPDGRRRVHYYRSGSAASVMDETDAKGIIESRPRALVVSGVTVALGEGPEQLVRTLGTTAAEAGALLVVDPNLRPTLGRQDQVIVAVRDLLEVTDLLVLGQDEAGPLFGETAPEAVFASVPQRTEVVLKAGPEGVWCRDGDARPVHVPSTARHVRDPVGAGDALLGGYLAARLSGASAERAARIGSLLAGRVVETLGDLEGLPAPDEAAGLMAGLGRPR